MECFPRYTTKERKAGAKLWLSNTKQGERKSICTYLCGHKLILKRKIGNSGNYGSAFGERDQGIQEWEKVIFSI